jgi:transposase
VKTYNIKAQYSFNGYVADNIKCTERFAQVELRFDKRISPRCPHCNSRLPKNKTGKNAVLDLPLGSIKTVWIIYPTIQGRCASCQRFVTTRPREIHPTKQATWRYMKTISRWAGIAPANQIAEMFTISASTVRNYDKAVLEEDTPPPELNGIRALLVDEKNMGKKLKFVTVVLNADTGELLHMDRGKKGESFSSFLRLLTPEQKASIQAVGMDRAGSYKKAVEDHLPDAEIVFDRFHLVMNINEAVNETRRSEQNKASQEDKKHLKGTRFLLLRNGANLDEGQQGKLDELIKLNESISTAYILKEQFQTVYTYKSKGWAKRYLSQWCEMARESCLAPFERLAKGFERGSDQIVSYIKHKITSGKIEGFNNLISRIIHRSCGISNLDYLYIRMRHDSIMRSV